MSIQLKYWHKVSGLFLLVLSANHASATTGGEGFNLGPLTQFGCTFINTLLGPFAVFYALGVIVISFALLAFARGAYAIIVKAFFVAGGLLFAAQIVDGLSGNRIQTLLAGTVGCTIIGM
jgi:type IV secretory pathway VirB2 component (pilin)